MKGLGYARNRLLCPHCGHYSELTPRHIQGQIIMCPECGNRFVISEIETVKWVETSVLEEDQH